jgi:hypothetical protein
VGYKNQIKNHLTFLNEWVNDCCVMPRICRVNNFSAILTWEQGIFLWWCPFYTRPTHSVVLLLKQQSTGRISLLSRHIILTQSQPIFAYKMAFTKESLNVYNFTKNIKWITQNISTFNVNKQWNLPKPNPK